MDSVHVGIKRDVSHSCSIKQTMTTSKHLYNVQMAWVFSVFFPQSKDLPHPRTPPAPLFLCTTDALHKMPLDGSTSIPGTHTLQLYETLKGTVHTKIKNCILSTQHCVDGQVSEVHKSSVDFQAKTALQPNPITVVNGPNLQM